MHWNRIIPSAAAMLAITGCGGEGPSSDFNVEVTPGQVLLFSEAPGNTATLTATATDDEGQVLPGGMRTFGSANIAVATVSDAGVVTAVAPGTTQVTTTITIDGTSASATTTVTVEEVPTETTVRAPAFTFSPGTADVRQGGTVTWTFANIPHAVDFTSSGAPADVPELTNGSASRTFLAGGTFSYRCPIHPQMVGVVRVR
jgi:plastocyanin